MPGQLFTLNATPFYYWRSDRNATMSKQRSIPTSFNMKLYKYNMILYKYHMTLDKCIVILNKYKVTLDPYHFALNRDRSIRVQ